MDVDATWTGNDFLLLRSIAMKEKKTNIFVRR